MRYTTISIAESVALSAGSAHVPVTFESSSHVSGPFFHGTRQEFAVDDLVVAGHAMNHQPGRIANHVYFTSLLEPAVWGAELAVARNGNDGQPRIYVVEPTGPFEDDPNVTNKKFPGNVTRSYRTRHPMRVVHEVDGWEPHSPDVLQAMLDNLTRLRQHGLDIIED